MSHFERMTDIVGGLLAGDRVDPDAKLDPSIDAQGDPVTTIEQDPPPDPRIEAVEALTEVLRALQPPSVIRREQADQWAVTVHEMAAGVPKRLGDANPARMLLEVNRTGHIASDTFTADLEVEFRVGPSQPAVESIKTSTVVSSGWSTNVVAEVWAIADAPLAVEVVESFRSGMAAGYPISKGG